MCLKSGKEEKKEFNRGEPLQLSCSSRPSQMQERKKDHPGGTTQAWKEGQEGGGGRNQ